MRCRYQSGLHPVPIAEDRRSCRGLGRNLITEQALIRPIGIQLGVRHRCPVKSRIEQEPKVRDGIEFVDPIDEVREFLGGHCLNSPTFTTSSSNELLLAFVSADGSLTQVQKATSVTGGGLAWTLAARSNTSGGGTAEVWQAWAPTARKMSVTATLAMKNDGSITVLSFTRAGHQVAANSVSRGATGAPQTTVAPSGCGSLIIAAGHDWSHAIVPIPVSGQYLVQSFANKVVNDTFWVQAASRPTVASVPVTIADSFPTKDRWQLAAVEVPGT